MTRTLRTSIQLTLPLGLLVLMTGCNDSPTLPQYPPDAEFVYREANGSEVNMRYAPPPADKLTYGGQDYVEASPELVEVPWNNKTVEAKPAAGADAGAAGEKPAEGEKPEQPMPEAAAPAATTPEPEPAPADQPMSEEAGS
jgi:hypothetical protein